MNDFANKNRILLIILWLSIASHARAEFDIQLYGGNGITQDHNASVNLPNANISGIHKNLKFNTSAIVGGKVIYWLDNHMGFGIDASHFYGPNQKSQIAETDLCVIGAECYDSAERIQKFNNNINAIAFEIMLRYPMLKSAQFNQGQLQPYLMVGPSIFFTTMQDTNNFIPASQSSTYNSRGVMAGAGIKLYLTKHIGAFIGYQDSHFQVKDSFYNARVVNDITLGHEFRTFIKIY